MCKRRLLSSKESISKLNNSLLIKMFLFKVIFDFESSDSAVGNKFVLLETSLPLKQMQLYNSSLCTHFFVTYFPSHVQHL